jgi:hypothetical protein
MTKRTWTGTCAAIVAAASIGIVAQTQTPPASQSSSAASADQITVTGCLKAAPAAAPDTAASGTAGATGTSGTASAAGATATDADAKFVLTNATVGAAAPASDASAAGSASAAAENQASADQKTFRLIANPSALSPHVGKKLELTGTLVNESNSTAGSSAAATAPALRVVKGKVVAASCEE